MGPRGPPWRSWSTPWRTCSWRRCCTSWRPWRLPSSCPAPSCSASSRPAHSSIQPSSTSHCAQQQWQCAETCQRQFQHSARGASNPAQRVTGTPRSRPASGDPSQAICLQLTTLNAAVKAAGLEATLASPGPFTVFAPTNLAFQKIPDADLQRLLGDKAALSKILLRHVVPGTRMQGKNIPPGVTSLKTAAGEQISATRDKFIQVKSKEGSAFIVLFDVIASNGVLHAVDTVF